MRNIEISWNGVISYENINNVIIPRKSGVYELCVKNNSDKWIRRYVGSTDDFCRRIVEHMSENENNGEIKKGIRDLCWGFDFASISDEKDYLDAEQGLYDKFKHSWNQKRPGGSGYSLYEIIES